jgi:hypothetical protein
MDGCYVRAKAHMTFDPVLAIWASFLETGKAIIPKINMALYSALRIIHCVTISSSV